MSDTVKYLLDETRLLREATDEELGRYLFWSPLNHTAALGFRLAALYRDRIYVVAHLLGRKVVVSDLDNTLWHGLIGEGAVQHDLARQSTLRRLRERGVLLAINSKNDPARVRWDGAALGPDDFVHAEDQTEPHRHDDRAVRRG